MLSTKLTVAAIQFNSGDNIEKNLENLRPMIREARSRGAELITTPENVSLIIDGRDRLFTATQNEQENTAIAFFRQEAIETGAWLLAGSLAIHTGEDRLANRSYLFNPAGEIVSKYDKIHMCNLELSETEVYRESDKYRPGGCAVIALSPWGRLGLTICYDVRFPHLYRLLAKASCKIIMVPVSWLATTGPLHWHVMARARAIETGCFIIGPAQCGEHDGGRRTYGHSLIINPLGQIIAEGSPDKPEILVTQINLDEVDQARRMLPSLKHDCEFDFPY